MLAERIIALLRQRGPSVPSQLGRELGIDSLITGAQLAELVKQGVVKISHARIGSSPVYYLPGQEAHLEILLPYLNDKDRKSAILLKEKGILMDEKLDPLTKVSFQRLKDFAQRLEVSFKGKKVVFWKWYMLPLEKAKAVIKELILDKASRIKGRIKEQTNILEKKQGSEPQPCSTFKNFLLEKGINIVEFLSQRKNDAELIVDIPSALGNLRYFCKYKKKKLLNEKDIAEVLLQSKMKGFPALLIFDGRLSKKAKEAAERNSVYVINMCDGNKS